MHSLKTLIIAFILAVTVILIGGYFAYVAQINAIIENRYNELAAIRGLKEKQIIDWKNELIGQANLIANNPLIVDELVEYLKKDNESIEKKISEWFGILKKSYKYKELLLLNNRFEPLLSSEANSKFDSEHLKEYAGKKGEDGIYISPLHLDAENNVHYTIKIELYDNSDTIGNFLILIDPNQFLFPLIQTWPTPSKTAETLLVREEGDSVLFLNELRHRRNTALKFKISLNSTIPAARVIQGETGLYRGIDYRGVKVLADIAPVPGTDWFIISKIDEEEIFSDLNFNLLSGIIIILLLIILSYLLFLFIWRANRVQAVEKELRMQKDKYRMSNLYATLSQINQAIVREQSRSELILKIPQLPVKFGDYAACSFSLKDGNTDLIKAESFYGSIKYFHTILKDDSTYRYSDPGVSAMLENKTVVYNSFAEQNEQWMTAAVESGIKSCAAAPIYFNNEVIGSLTLYSREETSFKDSEIKLLQEIVSDISFSLDTIHKNEKRKIAEQKIIENERRLAALFSNLPGIAYRCAYDKDWTMEFMSEGTLNITGYSPDEIVNNRQVSFADLVLPEDRQYIWDQVTDAVENKKSFTLNYRIKPRDGDYRWVWERGLPVFNANGEVVALEGFISDITEVKEAQDQIKKSEEYFRYLFHNNPLPMWIYDLEHYKFLNVNDAALSKYGYSRDEFLSNTLFDIRPDEEFEKLEEDLKKPRTKHAVSGEWKHKLKNGRVIDVLIISHQIEFENRPAVLVVALDITDRKKAEYELIEAKEKAETSEKLKTDFLAQMSHEIRTPVNVILSFASLIKDSVYPEIEEDLKKGFDAIDHAGFRLIRTIDSILNMAQITSGSFDFQPETLDIYHEILIPLRKEFESLASAKKLDFTLESACEQTLISGDRYSLSQTFANLIDNAIKYTEKGYVKVYLKCSKDKVSVYVEDSGIGMSDEYLPRLFSAFSQEETGYSRRYEGTGLGLALVNNYCKINNAEITVKSKKHEGTTFVVTFDKGMMT